MRDGPRRLLGASPAAAAPGVVAALILCAAAVWAPAREAAAQSPPPAADWRTFDTENFRLIYTPELKPLALRAAAAAERTHAILREEIGDPPPGRTDLVVTNHVDYSNGFANIFPSNRIVVYARPPTSTPQLAFARDWVELVTVHEVVHIFHLGESGPVGRLVRAVLGRVPMIWPVFPVAGSPAWNVEGLATFYESRITGAGRVRGSFHDMVARTAAIEDRIPDLHHLSAPHPAWPGGQRSYGYGSRLMEWIADRYGVEAHQAIVEATGRSIRPTFLLFDHVAERAVGEPFSVLWEQWRESATTEARALADSLRAVGLTRTEPVAGEGPYAGAPRVAPNGRRLSFAAHDYRSDPATRVVDLRTGAVRTLAERNQFGGILGPASWLPDGSGMVLAQLEVSDRYRAYSDLWRLDLDGTERRLTFEERLAQPDVAPDGRRVAAVRNRAGALQLVLHDLETGTTRLVAEAAPGEGFDGPRWSPSGRHIAAARHAEGRIDVVLVDAASGRITPLTNDDALDLSPAWTPDGRHVLWWSDRTGIPNIMAARAPDPAVSDEGEGSALPEVSQVTNVLTGAFDPEVSPDGTVLYLSMYHHDGWRIEGTRLDPDLWRPAPSPRMEMEPGLLGDPVPVDTAVPSSSYEPWRTLRPYYWAPRWTALSGEGGSLAFVGASIGGRDVLARHQWSVSAAVDPPSGRFQAGLGWMYRGLEPADIRILGSRSWSRAATLELSDMAPEAVWRRTDRLGADAFFWRQRWRSVTFLRVGAEWDRRTLEGHDLSAAELRAEGWELGTSQRTLGLRIGPGYANAVRHPFSISLQDGLSGSFSVGRWWDLDDAGRAYDEVLGAGAAYLGLPLGSFADHVLAVRVAGVARAGPDAAPFALGGVPGGPNPLPGSTQERVRALTGGAFLPVRGFDPGERAGTRAWAVSGEWRFPLYIREVPGSILGFSLTALSGTVFGDVGDAWCPESDDPEGQVTGCSSPTGQPLASAGAELGIDFGALHNQRIFVRLGVARPLLGPDGPADAYLSVGQAF